MKSAINMFFVTILVIGFFGIGVAEEMEKSVEQPVIIRFEGNQFGEDWARLMIKLQEQGIAPEPLQFEIKEGDFPCKIYEEKLNLSGTCGAEVQKLITTLNPGINPQNIRINETINFPNFPNLTTVEWGQTFDLSQEKDDYQNFIEKWGNYTTGEIELRPQIKRVLVRGWKLTLPEVQDIEALIEVWNALDIKDANIILPPVDNTADHFNSDPQDPIKYFEVCKARTGEFKLTDRSFSALKNESIPKAVLENVTSLKNKRFTSEEEFIRDVAGKTSYQEAFEYKKVMLKHVETKERGNYYELLHSAEAVSKVIKEAGCPGNNNGVKPLIVLVDKSGVYNHPDIKNAIFENEKNETDNNQTDQTGIYCPSFSPSDFDPDKHHGTHLAGIMVGQEKDNAHFVGLAQAVKLKPLEWNNLSNLKDDLQRYNSKREYYPIYVFAQNFAYNKGIANIYASSGQGLKDEEVRLREPAPVKEILGGKSLWVTAVGQPKRVDETGDVLSKTSDMSPMNLGDQKNVLVVTACEQCTGDNPTLWGPAHYDTADKEEGGLVNVAAPGGKYIPGIATNSRYTEARGTSQAAAYVGGLAAQMLACYPTVYYYYPEYLKERLQVTARPFSPDAPYMNERKVSGGIVDPEKALLDPEVHWLESSTIFAGTKLKVVSLKWLPEYTEDGYEVIKLGKNYRIGGDRIRRILKTPDNKWIMFRRVTDTIDGNINQFGPEVAPKEEEETFKLTDQVFKQLKEKEILVNTSKLRPIQDKVITGQDEFLAAIKEQIKPEELTEKDQTLLLEHAARTRKIVEVIYQNPDTNKLVPTTLSFTDIDDLLLKITSDDNTVTSCGQRKERE